MRYSGGITGEGLAIKHLRRCLLPLVSAAAILAGGGAALAHRAGAAPSTGQITARLRHTIEIGTPGEHFKMLGKTTLTIKDGRGTGTLTAVIGTRWPTADALGQVVFFWHNTTFIGQSANYETPAVRKLTSPAAGTFVITYVRYKSTDPACCPTLKPVKVTYGWSGHILISNGVPPVMGKPVKVKYRP